MLFFSSPRSKHHNHKHITHTQRYGQEGYFLSPAGNQTRKLVPVNRKVHGSDSVCVKRAVVMSPIDDGPIKTSRRRRGAARLLQLLILAVSLFSLFSALDDFRYMCSFVFGSFPIFLSFLFCFLPCPF